jgi:translation initiation factor 2 beta subunit (eIF-2beta)/eIF-5
MYELLRTLPQGSDSLAIKESDINIIQSVERRYLRTFKTCNRVDSTENEDIRGYFKVIVSIK